MDEMICHTVSLVSVKSCEKRCSTQGEDTLAVPHRSEKLAPTCVPINLEPVFDENLVIDSLGVPLVHLPGKAAARFRHLLSRSQFCFAYGGDCCRVGEGSDCLNEQVTPRRRMGVMVEDCDCALCRY